MKRTDKLKKAVVLGGSNGIGLSVVRKLYERNYHVIILDKVKPDTAQLPENIVYSYYECDLLAMNEELFKTLQADRSIEVLMITAGFGRVADFEFIDPTEIQNLFQVNTVSLIKVIKYFYDRIKSPDTFYCGIISSIAGMISSPLFSVYAASKASLCRFTESVNIELEKYGTKNRILNVAPLSMKGTRFNGGENDLTEIDRLSCDILENLFSSRELFIPQYNEICGDIIERYHKDPHEYGIHSYEYKMASGRVVNKNQVIIGYLSGTFDLFHIGHLNLLKRAKQNCDYLIVGVHPDASHKGKETFIPFDERKQIVAACRYVDKVVDSCREDCDAWELYHYHKLFVGSDYKGTERFNRYEEFFKDKGVEIIYFSYTQGTSSTQIRNMFEKKD